MASIDARLQQLEETALASSRLLIVWRRAGEDSDAAIARRCAERGLLETDRPRLIVVGWREAQAA